ncbi:MAG TPA: TonB-dependent receptor [Steroidobacteraceae bacterium]
MSAKKSRISELSILALGATLLAPYAIAQDQDAAATNTATTAKSDEDLTEILVTGIRKALQTSAEIKKESDTVVDSITASDIGAFPDKSVAEALQRMSGITVTRFAASGDTTHFSAEPSGVVIRGLPQVRSEFNGRDSFNANSSRGLSFADVSPELMAGVDTYKNSTAEMIEGGIAGTVNLRTHVPFDSEGFVAAFSGELGYGDLAEETKPAGSMLISSRWETGIGDIGLMANAAYSEVVTESQGVQLGRFYRVDGVAAYGGGTKWMSGGVDIRQNTYTRTRKGGSLAAQWASPEDTLLATLQYNRSEYENDWEEYSLSAGIGNSQTAQDLVLTSQLGFAPAGTPAYEFDSRGVFTSGVINDNSGNWAGQTNPTMGHPNGVYNNGTYLEWYCHSWQGNDVDGDACPATRGIGLSADTRSSTSENITEDLSLNLRWALNDRVGLNFDIQKIDSTVVNFDNSTNNKTATDLYMDLSGGKPRFEFRAPTGFGFTAGGFGDPQNWYHEWEMEHAEDSKGEELAYRLDADIKLSEGGWMDSLRVGVRRAERDQDVNWSTYNWASVQPLWGIEQDTPLFLNGGAWAGSYEAKDLGSELVGGGVFGGGTFLHPAFAVVSDYQATIDLYGNGISHEWVPLAQRTNSPRPASQCPVIPGTLFCPAEVLGVNEDTSAAYVMLKFGGDDTKWGNLPVKGNIGVRYVETDVNSTGSIQYPGFTRPIPDPGAPSVPIDFLVPIADAQFMNYGSFAQSGGSKTEHWLPSLNVRLGLTDDQFLRFAASRAMARPDMGLYKYYYGISMVENNCTSGTVTYSEPGNCNLPSVPVSVTPRYTASVGNPFLKPTTADQFDFTYEWYFSNVGQFTAALFYKKFNDYVTSASYVQDFTNNGVTRPVTITAPVNTDGASLKGFELAYQTFFDRLPSPWNGFGIQTNFTYVDNQGVNNAGLTSVSGGGGTQQDPLITFTDLPLEGFSDTSYNIVLMFEKEKYSARLAYNWRSEYMISQSDCCIKLPIWQDAYGQLDGSFHFKPSGNWDVYLDLQNILKAETVLRQQVNQDGLLLPRSWFTNDRRISLGLRYRIQ